MASRYRLQTAAFGCSAAASQPAASCGDGGRNSYTSSELELLQPSSPRILPLTTNETQVVSAASSAPINVTAAYCSSSANVATTTEVLGRRPRRTMVAKENVNSSLLSPFGSVPAKESSCASRCHRRRLSLGLDIEEAAVTVSSYCVGLRASASCGGNEHTMREHLSKCIKAVETGERQGGGGRSTGRLASLDGILRLRPYTSKFEFVRRMRMGNRTREKPLT